MAATLPTLRFLQRIRSPARRELIQRLTLDVWKTDDCNHFTDILIKNPTHTSNSDNRPHITLRMRTPEQIANKCGQTVHVYYNEKGQNQEYEGFKLYSERKDDPKNDDLKDD